MDWLVTPDQWTADSIQSGHEIGTAEYLFSPIKPHKEAECRKKFGGGHQNGKEKTSCQSGKEDGAGQDREIENANMSNR